MGTDTSIFFTEDTLPNAQWAEDTIEDQAKMLEVNNVVNRVLSTPFPPQPLLVLETSTDRAIHLAKAAVDAIAKVNAKKGRPTVVFSVNGPEVHCQVLFRRMRLLSQNDNLRLVLMASGAQDVAPSGMSLLLARTAEVEADDGRPSIRNADFAAS
ncbi:uncharacterized protein J4E79_011782 [Alternaria viburni]|uniref:uncharacterized protein n=1 Tax=Alternaria viburni TaxID=566460 RepID=UPI0020C317FB|nr:uncharacterized protein J4E79_011782 [Alternaria viburni]KAI4640943.1 hypothetical protein J4E79_011782 [Alternaria viburni]